MAFPEVPHMAALLVQFKALVRIALYLALAYIVIQLWQDPSGAATATKDLIGSVGHFFASIIDKVGQFVKSLGNHSSTPAAPVAPATP